MSRRRNFSRLLLGRNGALYSVLILLLLSTGATAAAAAAAEEIAETSSDPDQELEDIVDLHEPASLGPDIFPEDPSAMSIGPPYPEGGGEAPARLIRRIRPPDYDDGVSTLAGQDRRGPREISNIVVEQPVPVFSANRVSDYGWQWGQFLDHDIGLTEGTEEPEPIPVPTGDPFFDPNGNGGVFIPFLRAIFDPTTGTGPGNPREQINEISAFIDGTNVYGEDPDRTEALRFRTSGGKLTAYLRTSPGNFLPYNDSVPPFPNAQPPGSDPADFFLAGDIRVNEQVALMAMHTLWVREHNRVVDFVRTRHRRLSEEEIFLTAREIVVAELQVITYNEFLPILLGEGAIPPYQGFNQNADPGLDSVFSTAIFRLGHTMLSSTILRLDPDGNEIPEEHLALRDAFFVPDTLINEGGLEPVLKGLASQVMQKIDNLVIDDVRSFLFGDPLDGGLDLASLNIQRGRDLGLHDYNDYRESYGLARVTSFDQITQSLETQSRLRSAYSEDINNIDAWVGALSEDPLGGDILVGALLFEALVEQYTRLRDGDPNWWELILSPPTHSLVKRQTLAKVILRNTTIGPNELQHNVFVVP